MCVIVVAVLVGFDWYHFLTLLFGVVCFAIFADPANGAKIKRRP
jgi:hypothetical protein